MLDDLAVRLGQRRVVHALVLRGGPGEADLLSQDRLPGARRTGQDHDRPGIQAAVEDQVPARICQSACASTDFTAFLQQAVNEHDEPVTVVGLGQDRVGGSRPVGVPQQTQVSYRDTTLSN